MTAFKTMVALGALTLALAAPVAPLLAASPAKSAPTGEAARLLALTDAIEQDQLATSFYAQMRADKPITGFADYSLAEVARSDAKRQGWLKTLKTIDPKRLDRTDRETYEMVEFDLLNASAGEAEYWLTFDLTAYQAPMAIGFVNQILAGRPLATSADAAEYLRLVTFYATMMDTLVAKVDAQTSKGLYLPTGSRRCAPPMRDWTNSIRRHARSC
jgi:uncharacterized protein (DUF885 family)